jgi:hypothetical protein
VGDDQTDQLLHTEPPRQNRETPLAIVAEVDLARLIALWPHLPEPLRMALARWPELPEPIRTAILALVALAGK